MRISRCRPIDEVATWMHSSQLQLNANKTEFVWLSSSRRVYQISHAATTSSRVGLIFTSLRSSRPWQLFGFRHVCEVSLWEFLLFHHCTPCTYDVETCTSPVNGSLAWTFWAGFRQRDLDRHSCVPSSATSVGVECSRQVDILVVEVRPHQPAALLTSLADDFWADHL